MGFIVSILQPKKMKPRDFQGYLADCIKVRNITQIFQDLFTRPITALRTVHLLYELQSSSVLTSN